MSITSEITLTENGINETSNSKKHYDDRNEATAIGTVISIKEIKDVVIIKLFTTAGRKRDITSLVTVKATKEQVAELNLKEKARIIVNGKLRFRPVKYGDSDKIHYDNFIKADSVNYMKSDMEEAFGIKGRNFGVSENKVLLTGTIARLYQLNRFSARIVLSVKEADKERFIDTIFYARNNLKALLPTLAIGNKICAIAEIQNYKKDPMKSYTISGNTKIRENPVNEDPENIYVKNIVILDINEV